MEVRALQVKDVFTVAKMLGKITQGARKQLLSAVSDRENPRELGLAIIQSIFTEAEDDLKDWLADLIGVERAEFEIMPAVTFLEVIEQLSQREDIKNFFVKVSQLANRLTKKS